MRLTKIDALGCLLVAFNWLHAQPQLTLNTQTITLKSGEEFKLEVGRITLPQNRTTSQSHTLSLPFYRLKSKAKTPIPPIFILTGGPGSSGIRQFESKEMNQAIRFYQELADVVVFDQRGSGGSEPKIRRNERFDGIPLDTPATSEELARLFRSLASKSLAYAREQGMDPSVLNTRESAADVNDLRKALGYDSMILIGGSYGSHLGFAILRDYGSTVSKAIFYGIEGPDHTFDLPSHTLNAYKRIASFIETSNVYRDRLPKGGLMAAWLATIQRLKDNPIQITTEVKGKPTKIWITAELVQIAGKQGAGRRSRPHLWPERILDMYEGNYAVPARIALGLQSVKAPNVMKYMMDLSSGLSKARREAIFNDPANDWFSFNNLDYFATESVWQAPDLGDHYRGPLKSNAPVLLIHGTWDTSTPIENAYDMLRGLPKGHLIEVKRGNHGGIFNLYKHWPPAKEKLTAFLLGQAPSLPQQITLPKPLFPHQKP